MNWARVSSAGIAVACAFILIAHAPAVLTDPLYLAIAQIRGTAAVSVPPPVVEPESVMTLDSLTSAVKKLLK